MGFTPKFKSQQQEESWMKQMYNLSDVIHYSNKDEADRFKQNQIDKGMNAVTVTSLWNSSKPYTVYYGHDDWISRG